MIVSTYFVPPATHTHTHHTHRTSFFYNPALQSRSFLMLGVISQSDSASTLLITETLKVLEETMLRHEEDVVLLEAIIICLTRLVPLLDEVCEVYTSVTKVNNRVVSII